MSVPVPFSRKIAYLSMFYVLGLTGKKTGFKIYQSNVLGNPEYT